MITHERKTEIVAEFQRHLKGKPNQLMPFWAIETAVQPSESRYAIE